MYVVIDGMHRLEAVWKMIEENSNPHWSAGKKIPCLVYQNPPASLVLKWAKKNELLQGIANEKPSVLDHIVWVAKALQCHLDEGTTMNANDWIDQLMTREFTEDNKESNTVKERRKMYGLTTKEIQGITRFVRSIGTQGVADLGDLCNQDNTDLYQSFFLFHKNERTYGAGFDFSNAKPAMKTVFTPFFPSAGFLPKHAKTWSLWRNVDDTLWTKRAPQTWTIQPHILVLSACHAWWVLKGGRHSLADGTTGAFFSPKEIFAVLHGTRSVVFESGWQPFKLGTKPTPAWLCCQDLNVIKKLEEDHKSRLEGHKIPNSSAPATGDLDRLDNYYSRSNTHTLSFSLFLSLVLSLCCFPCVSVPLPSIHEHTHT